VSIYDIPVRTDEEKLRDIKRHIASSAFMIQQINMQHLTAFNNIWNNPDFTPQQVLDSFGTDAARLFSDSSATQTFLAAVLDGYEPLTPTAAYTINNDGTVTVG
jgi:hypothetical protein